MLTETFGPHATENAILTDPQVMRYYAEQLAKEFTTIVNENSPVEWESFTGMNDGMLLNFKGETTTYNVKILDQDVPFNWNHVLQAFYDFYWEDEDDDKADDLETMADVRFILSGITDPQAIEKILDEGISTESGRVDDIEYMFAEDGSYSVDCHGTFATMFIGHHCIGEDEIDQTLETVIQELAEETGQPLKCMIYATELEEY